MNPGAESSEQDQVVDLVASSESEAEITDSEISCRVSSPPHIRGRKRRCPERPTQDNLGPIENKLVTAILEISTSISKMVQAQVEMANTLKSFFNKMDNFFTIMERLMSHNQMNGIDSPVSEEYSTKRKSARTNSTDVNNVKTVPVRVSEPKSNTQKNSREKANSEKTNSKKTNSEETNSENTNSEVTNIEDGREPLKMAEQSGGKRGDQLTKIDVNTVGKEVNANPAKQRKIIIGSQKKAGSRLRRKDLGAVRVSALSTRTTRATIPLGKGAVRKRPAGNKR